MIAGSLNRLKRKGSTASSDAGPPRLNRTTAILIQLCSCGFAPKPAKQLFDMFDRRIGPDAVAQIEDVRAAVQFLEDSIDSAVKRGSTRDERERVEIALKNCLRRKTAHDPRQRRV